MKTTRILTLVLALILALSAFVGCNKKVTYEEIDDNDAVEHTDFTSVYETIGGEVTIDMVEEDEATGLAYVTVDGTKYELGMDFLSMAMVYNCSVPANSTKYTTEEAVFNEWWKLYIQRWNYLAPEVPLYSNQYFDLYNAKIQNFVTTPYWAAADAIVAATIKEGADNSVILGSATELSGLFRNSSWGKSSPGSSDLDIENLTSGHATVQTDKTGAYIWNMSALAEEPVKTVNADGTLTYTIKVKDSLKFSDGSAINAKNYIASLLANSTAVSKEAGGSGQSGLQLVGFEAFNAYTGEGETVYFSGVKLIDDYTFSVTYLADYANYYYAMGMASFSPVPLQLYLGSKGDIVVNANKECGLNADFYATEKKDGKDVYVVAGEIVENLKWNSALPYSGPYVVKNWDASALIATLELNPNYSGDDARGKATIKTITYIKTETETQMDKFKKGEVDVVAGITGGKETKDALAVVAGAPDKYAETHYDRAGYGKLGFRADFGPTGFIAVRQAVMYSINRPLFAQNFTGGYGSVVDGPYYEGYSAFQAVKNDINLNSYTYSVDNAIDALVDGGWIYNVEGKEFNAEKDAVRYKKLEGYEKTKENLHFQSVDGKYKTVKINGEYYMPLAINWYGTQPNDVTDQLKIEWADTAEATTKIGMYITYTETDFTTGLYGEYLRDPGSGYNGTPKLNAINFATGFTSAAYDYSWNWTIDPDLYDVYSACYVKDAADYMENYK
ncbi:MAG: hypothetical protein E7666_03520 [Ruminococcaceae bacterium]|nr:hypothetical protein [Oscillospiraceae bacterium]